MSNTLSCWRTLFLRFVLYPVLIPVYFNTLVTSYLKTATSFLPFYSHLAASHFQLNVSYTPETHHAYTTNICKIYASDYTFSI